MPQTVPVACSLTAHERPDRQRLMSALGEGLIAVDAEGREASLSFAKDQGQAIDRFVESESECCPFFGFEINDGAESTVLSVTAPEGGEWAVRGLVAGFVAGWGAAV